MRFLRFLVIFFVFYFLFWCLIKFLLDLFVLSLQKNLYKERKNFYQKKSKNKENFFKDQEVIDAEFKEIE